MEQLLTTKLYIPRIRFDLVPRLRLIEQMNEGASSGRKLTLISAPAGFGKTTLVSEWVDHICLDGHQESHTECSIAWLSLDENDNDPVRFLVYMIAALNRVEGTSSDFGESALGMLQSPQPPPQEAILTSLINEIADIPDKIIFVLDDYYLIGSSSVDDAIAFLLDNLPPQLHLVIATREDPHLPLARMRARGQMTELRAIDLRFTFSEAAKFLNQVMGLNLSAKDIAALETRTEGWITGLQLAAVSMHGSKDASGFIKSFTGSHRYILDYLLEEVLVNQSLSVQNFLLHTAILYRLTGSLCDAITDQENSQAILEMLDRANLFIVPLDEERRLYRYHHLFVDLLRQRLRQTQPEMLPVLHSRASDWYEQNGFVDDAIEHALRAEDFSRAAQLIERVAQAEWVRGVDSKLRRWLDAVPVGLVISNPRLCIFHAWYLLSCGDQDEAERFLQAAELALESSPDDVLKPSPQQPDEQYRLTMMRQRGRLATTQAFSSFYRGDITGIIQYARKALEYLPEEDLSWRSTAIHVLGDAYDFQGEMVEAYHSRLEAVEASQATGNYEQIMIANLKLAIILRQQGRLQHVIEICDRQMRLANDNGMSQTVVIGWLLAVWGEVLAEMNDLDGAIQHAKKGVEITERGGDIAMLGWSYICLIRVLYSRGEMVDAEELIYRIDRAARESYMPPWILNLKAAWQARIWLAQDKLEAATQWIGERGLDANRDPTYLQEMEYIVLARILIAQGKRDEGIKLLHCLLKGTEAMGRTSRAIEITSLLALALYAQEQSDQAIEMLDKALTLAEPGGFTRIFVDEGPQMARLLYEALSRGIAPEYVRRLLVMFPNAELEQTDLSKTHVHHSELVEPLSEREIEVLQLVNEGLTNPEIAARLYLSLNTVKAHTRNIYGKLGVNNRIQAVARAGALGILQAN